MEAPSLIEKIIDNARWAPSGDNSQPWRFQIIDDKHFAVHGFDTRDHCVYDLQGHASQLAIGALLESIAISASAFLHRADFKLKAATPEDRPTIDIFLIADPSIVPDPLFPFLPIRSVQRRMLKTAPLTLEHKKELERSVGSFYTIKWMGTLSERSQAAWLMYKNAKLRLTLPEAYLTHSTVIEWDARFSDDKIPDQAIGLDPIATKLMKWTMQSWNRVHFLNTYCFGTFLPRIQLDLLPGIFCAAHFAILAEQKPTTLEDYLNAGRAVQRFWLTATQLGLQLQPEMTPLIFTGYLRDKVQFTTNLNLEQYAKRLSEKFQILMGNALSIKQPIFLGRIGYGDRPSARSLRLATKKLMSDSF
jgi:hypothetical protein